MTPNPPKSYSEQLRDRRNLLMTMPNLTDAQKADVKLAQKLSADIQTLLQRRAGVGMMPRRPAHIREEAHARIVKELKAKNLELEEVLRRIPFIKS